jgi:WD40 repeat protein
LPIEGQQGHTDDILSICFCRQYNYIITGGHEGKVIVWQFETGFMKHQLHTYDKSCLSDNPVKDGKCVENMIWLDNKKMLITSTADQTITLPSCPPVII